jgi:hypothetical protein
VTRIARTRRTQREPREEYRWFRCAQEKRTRRRREGQRNTAWPCALSFAFHQPFLLPEDLTSSVGSGRPPVAGQPWLEETGSFWLSSPALAACVQEKTTPWARRRAGDGHGSPAAKVQNSAVLSPFRVGPFFFDKC